VKTEYDFKVSTLQDALKDVQLVLILAKQHGIEFEEIFEYIPPSETIIIDTRNVFSYNDAKEKGFVLEKI